MPAEWRPSVLAVSDLLWLFELRWNGQRYLLAEEPVDAPTAADGSSEHYGAGLDLGEYDDELDLFGDSASDQSIPLTLHLADVVDVPAKIEAGWDLQSATGRLMRWPSAGAAQDVVTVLDGVLREPEYDHKHAPVTCTLAEEEADAPGRMPPEAARYTTTTWTAGGGDTDKLGDRYPLVIGRPAGGETGSPCIAVTGSKLLVAYGHIAATSGEVWDHENKTFDTVTPVNETDDAGTPVATVTGFSNIGAPAGTLVPGDAYWFRWTAGGGILDRGAELRGAGSVLRWMLERSGARWDRGRTEAARLYLDSFLIDAYIGAEPDQQLRQLDWVREHLVPILPISLKVGPGGLYPVLWRWDATEQDVQAHINADTFAADRSSGVAYSSRDDVFNEITLGYQRNTLHSRHRGRVGATGDPIIAAADPELRINLWCRHSVRRYGLRPFASSTDVVSEAATADRIVTWWARRYALPSRLVTYTVDKSMAYLEPGNVVMVSDAEVGLSKAVGLVEAVQLRGSGGLPVSVRLLDRPAGRFDA